MLEIRQEPVTALDEYATVPIAFEVRSVFGVAETGEGFELTERAVAPYIKDHDAIPGEGPAAWPMHFDLSNWALFGAWRDGARVGGAAMAFDTPGVDMLEGRRDLAVLWDIRVAPDVRARGVGTALFRAAEAWARSRGCTELKVETQDIDVPACRFYARQGCVLAEANRGAYPSLPQEVQLIWRKPLR
jgi:GNAT superfamily N-acetyltransferase